MGIAKLRDIMGYTLVEVMVAILIAFIVLGGVYQTISRDTLDMERQEVILDMQNNARVAVDRISREIRRAGFFGCGGDLMGNSLSNAGTATNLVDDLTKAANPPGIAWDGDKTILNTIKGMAPADGVDYLATPLGFNNNAAATHLLYDEGTDAISLVYLAGDVPLKEAMATSADNPIKLINSPFNKGDIIYITDCRDASLFQKTNCSTASTELWHTQSPTDDCASESPALNPLNTSANLGVAYGASDQARLYSLEISTFYLKDNKLKHNANDFRTVASNIEDLQFEFLEDTDDDGDLSDQSWLASFGDPNLVRAIRVWVMAMSEVVNDYTNKETYNYPGNPAYAPNDNRYRYLASATVNLRN